MTKIVNKPFSELSKTEIKNQFQSDMIFMFQTISEQMEDNIKKNGELLIEELNFGDYGSDWLVQVWTSGKSILVSLDRVSFYGEEYWFDYTLFDTYIIGWYDETVNSYEFRNYKETYDDSKELFYYE